MRAAPSAKSAALGGRKRVYGECAVEGSTANRAGSKDTGQPRTTTAKGEPAHPCSSALRRAPGPAVGFAPAGAAGLVGPASCCSASSWVVSARVEAGDRLCSRGAGCCGGCM
jgi:hypothetical protein